MPDAPDIDDPRVLALAEVVQTLRPEYARAYARAYAPAHAHAHTHAYAHAYANRYGPAYANAYAPAYANAYANARDYTPTTLTSDEEQAVDAAYVLLFL